MVKNNLFTMITIASLCNFACYGIDNSWSTYSTKNNLVLQNDYDADEFYVFDRKTDEKIFDSTAFPPRSLHIEDENEIDKSQTTKIEKLPQVHSLKTGYGLAFLPQDSSINRNLKSLCEDPQNIQHFKTIARFLEDVHHLNNISRERSLENEHNLNNPDKQRPLYEKSPLAGIKRVTTLLRSRKIEDYVDKSYQDVNTAAKRLSSKLPESQQNQALKDLNKAVENAQYNRFQNKI